MKNKLWQIAWRRNHAAVGSPSTPTQQQSSREAGLMSRIKSCLGWVQEETLQLKRSLKESVDTTKIAVVFY